MKVAQSCPNLSNPMDSSLAGSSVNGILQETKLQWVALPFFRGSSWPRDQTQVSCIAGRFFTVWANKELKRQRNQRSNCQHPLDHRKSKRIPEKTSASLTTLKRLCGSQQTVWKVLQEMGIPDHLTWLLRNLYRSQETIVTTGHGTMNWFQIGKGVRQGCILSPAYLTYMQSTSCKMPSWMKHKLESRLLGEIPITSDMQITPPFMVEWRGTKEPLDEGERWEWKSWFKAQYSKN